MAEAAAEERTGNRPKADAEGLVRFGDAGKDFFPGVSINADVHPGTMMHPTATVGPMVKIGPNPDKPQEPSRIGAEAEIGAYCKLEGTTVGAGSELGTDVRALNSTVERAAVVESKCTLHGTNVRSGAYVKSDAALQHCEVMEGATVRRRTDMTGRPSLPVRLNSGDRTSCDAAAQWRTVDENGTLEMVKPPESAGYNRTATTRRGPGEAADRVQRPHIHAGAQVGVGVTLGAGVQIEKDAVVEEGCRLGAGAVVREGAVLEKEARLIGGAAAEKNALVRSGEIVDKNHPAPNRISPTAHIDPTADIDRRARVGPGSSVAEGAKIGPGADVGLTGGGSKTLGAAIGRRTELGKDSVVMRGAVIGDDCSVKRGALVAQNSHVKNKCEIAEHARVNADCVLREGTKVGRHADVGWGSETGERVVIGSGAELAPLTVAGGGAWIGADAVIKPNRIASGGQMANAQISVVIGEGARIGNEAEVEPKPSKTDLENTEDLTPGGVQVARIEAVGAGATMEPGSRVGGENRLEAGDRLTETGEVYYAQAKSAQGRAETISPEPEISGPETARPGADGSAYDKPQAAQRSNRPETGRGGGPEQAPADRDAGKR